MKTLIVTPLGQVQFTETCVQDLMALGHTQAEAEQFAKDALKSADVDVVIEQRQQAYKREADPLFIEYQFDQTPEAEHKWRAKVEEIKARYPKPVA